jgi:hypothetical protein
VPDSERILPPILAHLAGYPTIGGLIVPFVVLRHRNGDAAMGLVDGERQEQCLRERRCGVCGQVMRSRMVFLMREPDLIRKRSTEPGLCPPCAAYTQTACPMVGGQMEHYRRTVSPFITRECSDPRCPCDQWAANPEPARFGAPAEPWYALWTMRYRLIREDDGTLAAGFAGLRVLALRAVKQP